MLTIEQFLQGIPEDADLILPLGNGEPYALMDAIEEYAHKLPPVTIHQMLELKDRSYIHGKHSNIRYISYFMSGYARKSFQNGTCELVPNHFHQMPKLLKHRCRKPIFLCHASPMDEEGYFSFGTEADYVTAWIGQAPFYLQVNPRMPRTFGENRIHVSQVAGFIEREMPLVTLPHIPPTDIDHRIASYVAERIDNGSTIQVGIGGVPNAVASLLGNHVDLGIHTEMLTDGIMELVQKGVITGSKKCTHKGKLVATFAFGTQKLYDFIHENKDVYFLSVDKTNDPFEIAKEDNIVAINSTTEIDFYGQCASETVAGKYYSSSGGQVDFGTGVRFAKNGKGFMCLYATAKGDTVSRIQPILTKGSVVTTSKNDVDYVVTEYGIAELKGCTIVERTRALISIAHPKFREELTWEAKKLGFLI